MKDLRNISDINSGGKIILSNFKKYEQKAYSDNPSIKIVLSGKEHYWINNHYYPISENRFLFVDNNSEVEINIDANESVKGICIYPDKKLLNEVAKNRLYTEDMLLDKPFENTDIKLIHNQFNYRDNKTGQFLHQQIPQIIQLQKRREAIDFEDFYYKLSECIIDDQLDLEGKIKNISSAKKTTKEELYRRVAIAKDFVEDNFTEKINLDDIAQEAFLSKYHFTRTFKALFQLSPYQYLLQLRLNKAQELLALDYSYNEVSHLIGFSDGKNLRKAIKKMTAA